MKKLSINIISICIIAIMAFMTLAPVAGFCVGMVVGIDSASENSSVYSYPVSVDMMPDITTYKTPVDSIQTAGGDKYPFIIQQGIVMLPNKHFKSLSPLFGVIFNIGALAAFVYFAIVFIKFIVRINKGNIFEHRSVSLLRKISISLFIMAALQTLAGLCNEFSGVLDSVEIAGYTLGFAWTIPWAYFLMGFLALLMAEVWRRGIFLKEEQELTI